MICCSLLGAAGAAAGLGAWRRLAAPALIGAALSALAAFGALHAAHYAERAAANQRTLLAEILAAPICTGAAPAAP